MYTIGNRDRQFMRIQNIQTNIYTSQNNMQKKRNSQPSFQHLIVVSEKHWDSKILNAVLHNSEVKKFEKYLEKRNSVLELNVRAHGWTPAGEDEKISIGCIYDRHSKIDGMGTDLIPPTKKENVLEKLKKFKARDIIKEIELREHVAVDKIAEHIKELEPPNKKSFMGKVLGLFT